MEEVVSSECVNMEMNEEVATTIVEDKLEEPKVGMLFDSIDEINDFYLRYGKSLGFSVRKRSCKKGDDGEVRYMTFTCAREGRTQRRSNKQPVYLQPVLKTNCRARLSSSLYPDGKWAITSVVLDHNHELNPHRPALYRRKRAKKPNLKKRTEIVSFGSSVVEGGEDLNSEKIMRLRLGEGESSAMNIYFSKMQVDNCEFFYSMDLNNEGFLKNVFWADARSRAACKVFGDIVRIDTRCLVEKFKIPLVLFLGKNHHGQSVLLGCGLLCSQDIDAYTWLLECWLVCMSNISPSGIIMDHDETLKRAVEIVLPNAKHRFCLWDVMEKLNVRLNAHEHYVSIKSCIEMAVFYTFTASEFEERWLAVIATYNLVDVEWLSRLYEARNLWVPVFVKDSFWAGMSTTRENKSLTLFFDGFLNSRTALKKFLEQYENAMKIKVEEEYEEELGSSNSWVPCITHFEIEKQVQSSYTSAKFKEFQQELMGKIYCEVSSFVESVDFVDYEIYEDVLIGENIQRIIFKVRFSETAEEVECNCRLFQFTGILCRHAITVLTRQKIRLQIPEKYIINRWSKKVKRAHTRVKICYDDWSNKPERRRFENMCNAFKEVASKVAGSSESCDRVLTSLNELQRILETNSNGSIENMSKNNDDQPSCEDGSTTYK